MLNLFLAYSLLLGTFVRFYYHGKVVVPGKEQSVIKRAFLLYIRSVGWATLFVIGPTLGVGQGYREWWISYSTEHSMVLWAVVVIPVTVVLYAIKQMSYFAYRRPGHYDMFEGAAPDLCKLNMRLPLVWQGVFWVWVLFNPMLPFFNCFLRIFLLGADVMDVFPYV